MCGVRAEPASSRMHVTNLPLGPHIHRNIICWPCRCLAMCDGCREELAARPGSSSGGLNSSYGGLHDCPTCRSKVQGFSRVYI